jgi:hypothetical protein
METTNWRDRNQEFLEFESALREKIFNQITDFAGIARSRGLSTYFTSGLDLAADIALHGERKRESTDENQLVN